MGKFIDLKGKRFGRLVVIERSENIGKQIAWLVRCDCGEVKVVTGMHLRGGDTKSCGCFKKDNAHMLGTKMGKKIGGKNKTHGSTKSRLYAIWRSMKERCMCPSNTFYSLYGGRGITVCEEWCNSFEVFRDWAIANGYDENALRGQCTIDRIDVDGNYEPSNCRWATLTEQQNNKRNNHNLTYDGETYTIAEWSRIVGINESTIRQRLRYGWDIEDVLRRPVKRSEETP